MGAGWRRRLNATAAALAVVPALALAAGSGASASALPTWTAKVDSRVLAAATTGKTEFFVLLEQQADLSGARALKTKEAKGRYVYERLTKVANGSQPALAAQLELLGATHRGFWIVNSLVVTGDLAAVRAMAERSDVERVYTVGSGRLDPPVDVPGGTESTSVVQAVGPSIGHVRAHEAWGLGYRGQGAVVAGADTGVRWTHNALRTKYRGWNAATQVADHNYSWHDAIKNPNLACPAAPPVGASPQPCDDDTLFGGGHGTHTMGTIVGNDGGVNEIGMAPDAKWIACRNMNNGLGAVPTYLDCMQWFMAPTDLAGNNPSTSKAPDVVNNSWGCVEGCPPPALKLPLEASRDAGIVYVVSAGNDGPQCGTLVFPLGIYSAAFTVGATNATNDNIASFSSRGPVLADPPETDLPRRKPDISAPGVGIRSALRASDGAYGNLSGTSMAGPHVAGLVALIISANPALRGNVDRIEEIIERTAVPRPAGGCPVGEPVGVPNNVYGWGRINALDAVKLALNRSPVAVDDAAVTERDTPVVIDVLANDIDPEGDDLTVTEVSEGASGSTVNNGDGTVTYTPDPGFVGSDSFEYTVEDVHGNSDTATVFVTVTAPPRTTGGGWLAAGSQKTNFGFHAEKTESGLVGELQLNDRAAGVKIHLDEVTHMGPLESECGSISGGDNSLEFRGTGRHNGAPAAFRVCVQDNGEGANAGARDYFYLSCDCGYSTRGLADDDQIDGGNIQVGAEDEAPGDGTGGEPEASTIILQPLLASNGIIGQLQLLTATVYDQNQEPLANAALTITRTTSTGVLLLSGITDAAGTATVLATNPAAAAEYVATADGAKSNAIRIDPLG